MNMKKLFVLAALLLIPVLGSAQKIQEPFRAYLYNN